MIDRQRNVVIACLVLVGLVAAGCTSPDQDAEATSAPPASADATGGEGTGGEGTGAPPSAAGTPPVAVEPSEADGGTFVVGRVQAAQIHALTAMIADYNAGNVDAVLRRLDPEARWIDCDYATGETVESVGLVEIRDWLWSRADVHDAMTIDSFSNSNAGNLTAVGVDLSSRENDDLRERGFDLGIRPMLGSVAHFNERIEITLVGGGPATCDPGGVGVDIG